MLLYSFYSNVFSMISMTLGFHHILKYYHIETQLFEKYSINLMRSITCGTIAHEAYQNFHYIWLDKCLDNDKILHKFMIFHNIFLSYFVYDTILLWYQVYKGIEKKIRFDLLFHHILAISALLLISHQKMYAISLMIGLSEGMSLVTGPKLLSMQYGYKKLTNYFIIFRLLYLIFVRMLFIWPSLLYYYHVSTNICPHYKNERNMPLVFFLVMIIFHAEINWLHSGRKELARI